jgi:beta-xylosidase
VLRSEVGPLGPWELGPVNPLWYNGTEEEVQSTGHADVFEDAKGDWWAVFLGVRPRLCEKEWLDSPLGMWMSNRGFRISAKTVRHRKRDIFGEGHLGE